MMAGPHHTVASCATSLEEDGLRPGNLADGPVHAELLDQPARGEYYTSLRFSVGYRELQERWSRGWGSERVWDGAGCCSRPAPASPQHCPTSRNTALRLPLRETSASASPRYVDGAGFSQERYDRRWDSSTGSSPVGTPSSSVGASPCASGTSSPSQKRSCQERTSSCESSPQCVSSGSCCCRGVVGPAKEEAQDDRTRRGRLEGILEALRQALHSLRRRPRPPPPTTTLENQVVVLEAELESYKQLSAAKKRAADLLKHQLMEALYEQVVSQLEQQQCQQQLQQQMMALEVQLQVQRAAARRGLRQLNTQLQRALSEKQLLQRQVGLLLLPQDVTTLDYDVIMYEGCDVVPRLDTWHQDMNFCGGNKQPRRASH